MKLPKPTVSLAALVAANLVPLVGVLWFGWDATMIVLLYWAENIVIGAYNILRMALVKVDHPAAHLGKLFVIPFFCIHFGGFCAVHGFFLLALFGLGTEAESLMSGGSWPGPLVFVQLLAAVIAQVWRNHPEGMGWLVACLAVSHGISFVQNYLVRGERAATSMGKEMGRPYKRIAILHITIIAGAAPIMMLGSPVPLLCILVLLKTYMDVRLHVKSHKAKT